MKDLVERLRLEAHRLGHAVPRASHRRVTVRDDARVLSLYAIADEHRALQGFLLDGVGGRRDANVLPRDAHGALPVFHTAGDSRRRDDSYELLEVLADYLLPWFDGFRDDGFPQLVLPGEADWALLREISADARRPRRSYRRPRAERLAQLLGYHVQQAEVAGQQCVVLLTRALADLYVTGMPAADEAHLGAFLAWFEASTPTLDRLEEVEQLPAGIRTRPEWDNRHYLPVLEKLNAARKAVALARADALPAARVDALAAEVRDADALARALLWDHVAHQHGMARRALRLLADPALAPPPLPSLGEHPTRKGPAGLVALEVDAWRSFLQRFDPMDRACAAWHAAGDGEEADAAHQTAAEAVRAISRRAPRWMFTERQERAEALDWRVVVEDRYARAEARLRGVTVHGRVVHVAADRVPNPGAGSRRWFRTTVVIETEQESLVVTRGTAFSRIDPGPDSGHSVPDACWTVTGIERPTRVTFECVIGVSLKDCPVPGQEVEFLPAARLDLRPYRVPVDAAFTHVSHAPGTRIVIDGGGRGPALPLALGGGA